MNASIYLSMPVMLHRMFACLTILSVIAPSAFPVPRLLDTTQSGEVAFDENALAPADACIARSFDPVRVTFVRLIEPVCVPRHAGAGETSIHRAFREVERLLRVGEPRQALILSEVLADDLSVALRRGSIQPVMNIWNARFPSDLSVDVIDSDLGEFEAAFDQILALPEYIAAQTPADDLFMKFIWHSRFEGAEAVAERLFHSDPEDLMQALDRALDLWAYFKVSIPRAVRKHLKKSSPLSVDVYGLKTVQWIRAALEEEYPVLANIDWQLRTDRKIPKGSAETVNPAQRLYMVLPRDPSARRSSVSAAA